ncbi:hypothetical protein N8J89_16135 [Crossiella sp. CA-258035]|uniref:hypothetical protein n=1 Tax=Crossiella sp. CA-258035 TaxID=2981138 RepID=UPI0024BD1DDB|nr:hypothetical protein [Crossiella sp. CA-258035]WHT22529.1 hypothetical protein N8J89_16135 [Crossiella sp. CA-258035]
MKAVIAWWDRDAVPTLDIPALRESLLAEGANAWAAVSGLVTKFWISDGARWGAVMVFESAEAARQSLSPNRAAELIGHPATVRHAFDVEAFVTPQGKPAWQ